MYTLQTLHFFVIGANGTFYPTTLLHFFSHKEVMNKLESIGNQIEDLGKKLQEQTATIKEFVLKQAQDQLWAHLETVGNVYQSLTRGDKANEGKLVEYWPTVEKDLNHLEKTIGQYFRAYQNANYGNCIQLSKLR